MLSCPVPASPLSLMSVEDDTNPRSSWGSSRGLERGFALTFRALFSRLELLTAEITEATDSVERFVRKLTLCEGKLGVARLLSLVSPTGHSLISWAAACGQTEIVKLLMDHGAAVGPGDDVRTVAARMLQVILESSVGRGPSRVGSVFHAVSVKFRRRGDRRESEMLTCVSMRVVVCISLHFPAGCAWPGGQSRVSRSCFNRRREPERCRRRPEHTCGNLSQLDADRTRPSIRNRPQTFLVVSLFCRVAGRRLGTATIVLLNSDRVGTSIKASPIEDGRAGREWIGWRSTSVRAMLP